jgi:hypothetical protein
MRRHSIIKQAFDQLEVATGGERFTCPGHDHCINIRIVIDIAPNVGELSARLRIY